MNTRPEPRKISLVSKVLIALLLCLLCLIGTLSYALLGRGPTIQRSSSRTTAFEIAQFTADARTLAAALSYLLEAEPPDVVADSNYTPALRDVPVLLGKASK